MRQVLSYKRTFIVFALVAVMLLFAVQVFAYGHGGGGQNAGSAGAKSAGGGTKASGGQSGTNGGGINTARPVSKTVGLSGNYSGVTGNVGTAQQAGQLAGQMANSTTAATGQQHVPSVSQAANGSWNASTRPSQAGGGGGGWGGNQGGGGTVVVPCVGSGNTGSKGGGNGCIGSGALIQRPATGNFDGVYTDTFGTCLVNGWAYDPDNSSAQIDVHVYKDGWAGFPGATIVTACTANQLRTDVNAAGIPGNHGFQCQLPQSYIGSGNHALYIHAIDINATGPNNLLLTNGKTLNCAPSSVTPPTPTPTPPIPPTPPQCSDTKDNDGDGLIDFSGTDPGCTDANDNDETDPPIITANNKGGSVTVRTNSPVDIDWNPNGNASCKLSANLTDNTPSNSDIGTQTVTVQSQTTFTITCAGGSDSVVVKVLAVIQET